jgi:hypothetical protein
MNCEGVMGTIGEFMDNLERRGLYFHLVDGRVTIDGSIEALDEEQRAELVERRGEVEALVRLALEPRQPETPAMQAEQMVFGQAA